MSNIIYNFCVTKIKCSTCMCNALEDYTNRNTVSPFISEGYDRIVSLREEIWGPYNQFSPTTFIKMTIPSYESERTCRSVCCRCRFSLCLRLFRSCSMCCFSFDQLIIILYTAGQSLLASTVCNSANVQNEPAPVEGNMIVFFNARAK